MSLQPATPQPKGSTVFDIIAIPAIGADPDETWRLPPDEQHRRSHIWSKVTEARTIFFTFDGYDAEESRDFGITDWAERLLEALRDYRPIAGRDVHFAAHSTGGLVLKRALVIAMRLSVMEPEDDLLSPDGPVEDGDKGNTYRDIIKHCHSIAFFGTPHYSSTALSDGACAEFIRRELGLDIEYGPKLRRQLRDVEGLDWMQGFSRRFAPVTLELRKIWSFYEELETPVNVNIKLKGSAQLTETQFWMPIVDKRSATLTCEDYYIGCEQVIPIKATHAGLPRFANGQEESQLDDYNGALSEVMKQAIFEQDGYRALSRTIHAECHQFYKSERHDGRPVVRVLSADPDPTLMQLFQHGPAYFIEQRRDKATRPLPDSQNSSPTQQYPSTENGSRPSTTDTQQPLQANVVRPGHTLHVETGEGRPTGVARQARRASSSDQPETTDDPGVDDFGGLAKYYMIPDSSQYIFRWVHVPSNNMRWVEKVLRGIEREIETSRLQRVQQNETDEGDSPTPSAIEQCPWNTEHSDEDSIINDILDNPLANPAAPSLYNGASEIAKETRKSRRQVLSEALRKPSQLVEVLERSHFGVQQECTELGELGSVIDETREQASMLKVAQRLPEDATLKHTVYALNNTVLKRRSTPSITSTLFNPIHWNFKQNKASHGHSHGRYMMPSFEAFLPKPRGTKPSWSNVQHNPVDALQAFLYFPYLHWDTFAAVRDRNKLLKSSKLRKRDCKTRGEIFDKGSNEKKVIWQYATNPSDLSLHPRRTLDQYGYSDLENTETRDADQAIFRWRTGVEIKSLCSKPGDSDDDEDDDRSSTLRRHFEPPRLTKQQRKHLKARQEDFKVLMVDQLWCWIVDKGNVVTFFPERDDPDVFHDENKGKYTCNVGGPRKNRPIGTADLREAIYDDINRDSIFQLGKSECEDCLDFMATVVWHAVTLFLDTGRPGKPIETDLSVLRIFAESLCDIKEKRTNAFSAFKETQQEVLKCLIETKSGKAMDRLVDVVTKLGNCYDLTCLINVQDIADELSILEQLFAEQLAILSKMVEVYKEIDDERPGKNKEIDVEHLGKEKHDRAIVWLQDAIFKVKKYAKQVKDMKEECKEICESYHTLLDMKQKETNVVEAACARVSGEMATRQNYAMMTFTVVTVLFLPLSFFTSLFGMNVREWSNSSNEKTLHAALVLAGAASAGIIVVALAAAFWTFWTVWLTNKAKNLLKPRAPPHPRWWVWRSKGRVDQEPEGASVRSPDEKFQSRGLPLRQSWRSSRQSGQDFFGNDDSTREP